MIIKKILKMDEELQNILYEILVSKYKRPESDIQEPLKM